MAIGCAVPVCGEFGGRAVERGDGGNNILSNFFITVIMFRNARCKGSRICIGEKCLLVCRSVTSGVCLLFMVELFFFWLPEVSNFFRRLEMTSNSDESLTVVYSNFGNSHAIVFNVGL